MAPERWEQIERLYHAALEREPDARAGFLDEACADDEFLRNEVAGLLACDVPRDSFIQSPAIEIAARALANDPLIEASDKPMRSLIAESRIGAYQMLELLGRGGMGEVHLALDTRLGRKVAIKLLPAEFTTDAGRVRRFAQEARAASALNHPNIITIHEIGEIATENGNLRYIVTEYVEGETLRQRMARAPQQRIEPPEAIDIALQIAAALAAAHEAGITHRDIKPENVMVRRDGIVKVLDFGLAKLTEPTAPVVDTQAPTAPGANTESGVVMGTPRYMSPEQARGEKVDARTDIFCLGVMLYEMVTGRVPFVGATTAEVIAAILRDEPAPLTDNAPQEMARIVGQALRKDRAERYQSVKDLLIDLKDLKRELEIESRLQRSALRAGAAALAHGTDGLEPGRTAPAQATAYLISEIKRHKKGIAALLVVLAIAAAGGGVGLYRLITLRHPRGAGPPMRVVPFTTFDGNQVDPAFSPDGNQIAFSWDSEKGNNFDIYVKLVDGGDPLRLTTHPGQDVFPSWGPDGRSIAFYRTSPEGKGYYRVSALGGVERLVAELKGVAYGFTWSPNDKALIASERLSPDEPAAIYSIGIETGERRKLIATPQEMVDFYPTVSPDGKSLLFYRTKSAGTGDVGGGRSPQTGRLTNPAGTGEGSGSLYIAAIGGGEHRQVLAITDLIQGHGWSADGSEIVFGASRAVIGAGELWRVSASGGVPDPLALGANAVSPVVARQGGRLAFVQRVRDLNIYRLPITRQDVKSIPPAKFISSTLSEYAPQYSPDSKRIAFVSDRSGSMEIWVCDAEGLNAVQLTYFGNGNPGSPRWSPDSRRIAFDARTEGQADVYVISADGGAPHRLTTEPSEDINPAWSRDGRWLYFCSGRSGSLQIWKMPAEGGPAIQLTKQGGFEGFEETSGKFFYYAKGRGVPGIWKAPVDGGEETPVVEADKAGLWRNWALTDQGIYFTNSDRPEKPVIEFFSFATGKATKLTSFDRRIFGTGIALSPDGRWLLFSLIDRQGRNIMLVDNFH
jgi:Tol biopolymer transport system component/serine/threonine protein kinase